MERVGGYRFLMYYALWPFLDTRLNTFHTLQAVLDPYVYLPNGVGALLSLAQVALSLLYPAKVLPVTE